MGLLDDAIREHLELKRKHGADPTEVARQEREALGSGRLPPRPADPDAAMPADPTADGGGIAVDDAPGAAPAAPLPPALEEPLAREDLPQDEPHERAEAVSYAPEPEPAPAPEPEIDWDEPAPAPAPAEPPPAAGAAPDEDVLEETPEFLQETPEHDRLWFEQRPPKDFDF